MNPPTITKITTYRYGIVFHVTGSTGEKYIVDYNFHKGWLCDCPDHTFRHSFCKHMQACRDVISRKFDLKLPSTVWCDNPKSEVIVNLESESMTSHTLCDGVVKDGCY